MFYLIELLTERELVNRIKYIVLDIILDIEVSEHAL